MLPSKLCQVKTKERGLQLVVLSAGLSVFLENCSKCDSDHLH